jgi:hypothetical protein
VVPKELITTFPEAGETGAAQAELHNDLLSEMSDLLPIKEKTSVHICVPLSGLWRCGYGRRTLKRIRAQVFFL